MKTKQEYIEHMSGWIDDRQDFRDLKMGIPPRLIDSLAGYLADGELPGGFLVAVLSNDLQQATYKASTDYYQHIGAIGQYLYRYAPGGSWGSLANVIAWADRHQSSTVGMIQTLCGVSSGLRSMMMRLADEN
jgi:hypothetical protein